MSFKTSLWAACAAVSVSCAAHAEIRVEDPYARASNAMAGAAFMRIRETDGVADRLIEVRSNSAARVELHTHVEDENGVMKMMQVEDGFELPAGGVLHLKRGGYHIMFMGLVEPFEHGDEIEVVLIFENAGEVPLTIPVDLERVDMMSH